MDWSHADLVSALVPYEVSLRTRGLAGVSVKSYLSYARRFLRWRIGDYAPRGHHPRGRSLSRSRADIATLRAELGKYAKELAEAGLRPAAITTYTQTAALFLTWLERDSERRRARERSARYSSGTVRASSADYRDRIRIVSGTRGGQPTIRGLRLTVADILGYLAAGMSEDEILADFPDLERPDIRAALAYAADRERQHAVVME